jgi:hypothetical protein
MIIEQNQVSLSPSHSHLSVLFSVVMIGSDSIFLTFVCVLSLYIHPTPTMASKVNKVCSVSKGIKKTCHWLWQRNLNYRVQGNYKRSSVSYCLFSLMYLTSNSWCDEIILLSGRTQQTQYVCIKNITLKNLLSSDDEGLNLSYLCRSLMNLQGVLRWLKVM